MGYDFEVDNNGVCLTHVKALLTHPNYELVAGVDPSLIKRKAFENKFNAPAYNSINDCLDNIEHVDFAIISATSNIHQPVFENLAQRGVKNILCEKPVGLSLIESQSILEISKKNKVNTFVNYIRRYDPEIIKLKVSLDDKELGDIKKIKVYYSGDYYNNASHFIDLMLYFINDYVKVKVFNMRQKSNPDFLVYHKNNIVSHYIGLNGNNYELLEMDIICANGRIRIENGGRNISLQSVHDDDLFLGYKVLKDLDNHINSCLNKIQFHVLESIKESIFFKKTKISCIDSAIKTSEILQLIKDNMHK